MKPEFLLLFCIFHQVLYANCDPVVNTRLGALQGVKVKTPSGNHVDAFLGIPYAKPPIGPYRFLPPQRIEDPWHEVLNAKYLPSACIQGMQRMPEEHMNWYLPNSESESEDCLYLNIWVPDPQPERAAVMVWIHGGGFNGGSSNLEKYDGAILAAEESVIVVTINYRLGMFGFLHLPETDAAGNMGLFDQVEALKWIQENIADFGGDKKRVAIVGESAGGISVAMHLVSPHSKDLFHSAIIQSGTPSAMDKFMDKKLLPKVPTQIITNLHCSNNYSNQAIVDCLREVTEEALQEQMLKGIPLYFRPITDGNFFTRDFQILMQRKQFHKVDVMLGTTSDDGSTMLIFMKNGTGPSIGEDYFPSGSDLLQYVKIMMPTVDDLVRDTVKSVYTDWEDPDDPLKIRQEIVNIFTDYYMTCGTNTLAKHLAEAGRNVYSFQFSHTPSVSLYPKWMGSNHGDEIDFIFGHPLNPKKGFNQEEVQLSKEMMQYWANFAKYSNPNGKAVPSSKSDSFQWPKYTTYGKEYINLTTSISSGNGIRLRECAFWDHVFPELLRHTTKKP